MAEKVNCWLQVNKSKLTKHYKENFNSTEIEPEGRLIKFNSTIRKIPSIKEATISVELKTKSDFEEETCAKNKRFP